MPSPPPRTTGWLSPQEPHPVEAVSRLRAEDLGGGDLAEPAVEDRGVDLPEVDGADQVLVVVEVDQARLLAVEAAGDAVAHHEQRGGGAVVGTGAVLLDPPAEFGERHQ